MDAASGARDLVKYSPQEYFSNVNLFVKAIKDNVDFFSSDR